MVGLGDTKYCPECEEITEVLRDEPWIGSLCKRCLSINQ
jgi:hypothetical protein